MRLKEYLRSHTTYIVRMYIVVPTNNGVSYRHAQFRLVLFFYYVHKISIKILDETGRCLLIREWSRAPEVKAPTRKSKIYFCRIRNVYESTEIYAKPIVHESNLYLIPELATGIDGYKAQLVERSRGG